MITSTHIEIVKQLYFPVDEVTAPATFEHWGRVFSSDSLRELEGIEYIPVLERNLKPLEEGFYYGWRKAKPEVFDVSGGHRMAVLRYAWGMYSELFYGVPL